MQIDIKLKGINGHNNIFRIFGVARGLAGFGGNATKTKGKLSRKRDIYGDETNVHFM